MALIEKEWFIQAPWGRLCIVVWGNSLDPPVLMCHGSADSAVSFRPLVKLLPKNFYYIAMEIPGNGKSDPFPPGMMISVYDLVYSLQVVVKHYRWDKFNLIAHSLGAMIGDMYNLSYPGVMSKMVSLDPIRFSSVPPQKFGEWYIRYFTRYYENYDKYNSPKENGAKRTWKEAVDTVMKIRGISEECARATLERYTEPVGDGLIRYTYDNRTYKMVTTAPFSPDHFKRVFTEIQCQKLTIVAEESLKKGLYPEEILLNEDLYPNKNYRVRKVAGNHDVHVSHPERMASYISQFLLYGVEGLNNKGKL